MKIPANWHRLTIIFLIFSATVPAFGQATFKDHIIRADADGRGEVMTTEQANGLVKFWNLADGKLVEKMNNQDVQLPLRTLRYKMQNFRFLESGFTHDCKFVQDSFVCILYTNKEFTVRISQMHGGWVRNRATHSIAVYSNTKGVANILLVDADNPTDENGKLKGRQLQEYLRPESTYTLKFSPKGNWLVDLELRQLINMQSSQIISFADAVQKNDKLTDQFSFTGDEKLVSFAVKGYGIKVIDTETGKLSGDFPLPKSLQKIKGHEIYPAADGKSFLYTGTLTSESMDMIVQDAFLVKGKEVIELKD